MARCGILGGFSVPDVAHWGEIGYTGVIMESFSKLLDDHMTKYGTSDQWLGDMIGRNRKTIGNWRSGKSIPKNRNDVLECAKWLKLEKEDTNRWLIAAGHPPLEEEINHPNTKKSFPKIKAFLLFLL